MRVRSIVLSAVVAVSAAIAVPSPALAGSEECTLVMPAKVVLGAKTVTSNLRLGSNCTSHSADHAYWDLVHSSGKIAEIDFTSADFSHGVTSASFAWNDDDPKGRYTSRAVDAATAGGVDLTQNSPITWVKYASRLRASTWRDSGNGAGPIHWSISATQWSGAKHAWVGRPRVAVALFHRATTTSGWKYVKSVTTSSTGRASGTIASPKRGSYFFKVGETPTVWASGANSFPGCIC